MLYPVFPFALGTRVREPFLVPFAVFHGATNPKECSMPRAKSPPIANRLLASLPKKDFERLERHFEEVPLVFEDLLYKPNALISDVYFPNSGIVSLLAGINERSTIEVGLVGNKGMVGLSVFFGVNYSL